MIRKIIEQGVIPTNAISTKITKTRLSSKNKECRPFLTAFAITLMVHILVTNLLIEPSLAISKGLKSKLYGQDQIQHTLAQIRKVGFEARLYQLKLSNDEVPVMNLYRIINPLADKRTLNRYPVLYGHGLLFNAYNMISKSERSRPRVPKLGEANILPENGDELNDYCMPFMLSNNNFDVWLYDARASSSHLSELNQIEDTKLARNLWNFTLDNEALEDLPLVMNFILEKTHANKMIYFGYSESTMFMFALLSTRPEIADKLAVYVALAPVSFLGYVRDLVLFFTVTIGVLPDSFNYVPSSLIELFNRLISTLCRRKYDIASHIACRKIMLALGANGDVEQDRDFLDHPYKATSIRAARQFAQIIGNSRFAMYDYGRKGNMKHYGQPNPPLYNLTKIKCDRMIFVRGGLDRLATPGAQRRMLSEIGSKPYLDLFIRDYGHYSFVDGKNLISKVNEPVMRAIYALLHKEGIQNMTVDLSFSFEADDLKT